MGKQIVCPPGIRIIDYLREKDLEIFAPCGGAGTCGKCIIRVRGGFLPVTDADRSFLSQEAVKEGFRLACRALPASPVRIEIIDKKEESFHIMSADSFDMTLKSDEKTDKKAVEETLCAGHGFAVAIDIGTTTIAAALVDTDEKRTVRQAVCLNSQRAFGHDVVARQKAAVNGREEALKSLVVNDILSLIEQLTFGKNTPVISYMCIAANTTMQHLLMEYDCSGISAWPFTPVSLGEKNLTPGEIFGEHLKGVCLSGDCRIDLIPGVSTYVGGDVSAGMLEYGFHDSDKTALLIDMGTNAEMALLHKGVITVASAAAGPAFEGGNLKCGTGSVPGAISRVEPVYRDIRPGNYPSDEESGYVINVDGKSDLKVDTIEDAKPSGICGTGALEAVAAFLDTGVIDRHGTFDSKWFEKGFVLGKGTHGQNIFLDQEDIRQIQMAKGAIRAGADALLRAAGITGKDVDRVILAGGFGTYTDPQKAVRVGLLAPEFAGKCIPAGNTALKGAVRFCLEASEKDVKQVYEKLENIINNARQYELANDEYFKERYIECMEFE